MAKPLARLVLGLGLLLLLRPPSTTAFTVGQLRSCSRRIVSPVHLSPKSEPEGRRSPSPSSFIETALSRPAVAGWGKAALALFCLLLPPPSPAAAAALPSGQQATTTTTILAASDAAAANLPPDTLATALVSLGKSASLERLTSPSSSTESSPALYVTARAGQRGRVLASVRVPLSDLPGGGFPAEIRIRTADVYADTPEQREEVARSVLTQDLVLSARLDKDGQAGTRDPEDLVGQGVLCKFRNQDSAQWSRATIELSGRGAFGELVTGKAQKRN